jgi:hypothetical protein
MSIGRVAFVHSLPYALSPDDPPGGGAPPAPPSGGAPPAPAAPPAAAPPPPAAAPPPAAPATLAGGTAAPPAAGTPPAAGAPPASPGAPATLAGGAGTPPPVAVPANWPDNWRDNLAGDDKAYRARLDRFDSPAALAKSYRELEAKVSSGELKAPPKPLAADAKPEEVAAWRKEQGLPENADGYVAALALPNGIIPGEADKPLLSSFADAAMKANWTPAQYNQAVGWYYGLQDQLLAERQQADAELMRDSQTALVQEWGNEYKTNQSVVSSFIEKSFPKDFGEALLTARLPNGNVVGNDPMFNRTILAMAKEFNPAATLLPAASGSTLGTVDSEIATIEAQMRAPKGSQAWNSYWIGEAGAKTQERYRGLLGARESMRAKAKVA